VIKPTRRNFPAMAGPRTSYIEDELSESAPSRTRGQERDVLLGGSDSPGGILEICSFLMSMARFSDRLLGV